MKPSEVKRLLTILFTARENVLLKGAPGVGKTDIVKQAAEAAGFRTIICHPVVDEPIDYKGLPWVVDGKAEFIPIGHLREMLDATEPTVVFFDDLGQASPSVQAATMQILLARAINGHRVSDEVTFVAATNRREDRAGVHGILEPVKSRFAAIIEVEPDLNDWVAWAAANGMPSELIAFIMFRPDMLTAFAPTPDITNTPTPRTVAAAGRLIKVVPEELRYEAVSGACGEGFATEFEAFVRIYANLPDPKQALQNPDAISTDGWDVASKYAFVMALIEHVEKSQVPAFIKLVEKCGAEFAALGMIALGQRKPEMRRTSAFTTWAARNANLFVD